MDQLHLLKPTLQVMVAQELHTRLQEPQLFMAVAVAVQLVLVVAELVQRLALAAQAAAEAAAMAAHPLLTVQMDLVVAAADHKQV